MNSKGIQKKCGSFDIPFKQNNQSHPGQSKHSTKRQHIEKVVRRNNQNQKRENQQGETSEDDFQDKTKVLSRNKKQSTYLTRQPTVKKDFDKGQFIDTLNDKLKNRSQQYVPEYFVDILNYMIEKQANDDWFEEQKKKRWRQIIEKDRHETRKKEQQKKRLSLSFGIRRKQNSSSQSSQNTSYKSNQSFDFDVFNWNQLYDSFAVVINCILGIIDENQLKKSVYPTFYILYMLFIADSEALRQLKLVNEKCDDIICYHIILSLFVSTKYHQIYPMPLDDIIENINEFVDPHKVYKSERVFYELNGFSEFYQNNEFQFLKIFIIIAKWGENHGIQCANLLKQGLTNPHLYEERPSFKANAVIAMYEKKVFHTTENTQIIRQITGITLKKEKEIIKLYLKSMEYNRANHILSRNRSYYEN